MRQTDTGIVEVAASLLRLPDDRLIMHRRDSFAPSNPNMLGLFGGGLEADETPSEAVRRELVEETSLLIADLELVYVLTLQTPHVDAVVFHLFDATVQNASFEVYEGVGAETYTLAALMARTDVAPNVRFLMMELINRRYLSL